MEDGVKAAKIKYNPFHQVEERERERERESVKKSFTDTRIRACTPIASPRRVPNQNALEDEEGRRRMRRVMGGWWWKRNRVKE